MTSVLLLQRFTKEERTYVHKGGKPDEYEIFMAVAERVGWDLRGQPVFLRTPEGEEILRTHRKRVPTRDIDGNVVQEDREVEEPIVDDQIPAIIEMFKQWLAKRAPHPWQHD